MRKLAKGGSFDCLGGESAKVFISIAISNGNRKELTSREYSSGQVLSWNLQVHHLV